MSNVWHVSIREWLKHACLPESSAGPFRLDRYNIKWLKNNIIQRVSLNKHSFWPLFFVSLYLYTSSCVQTSFTHFYIHFFPLFACWVCIPPRWNEPLWIRQSTFCKPNSLRVYLKRATLYFIYKIWPTGVYWSLTPCVQS